MNTADYRRENIERALEATLQLGIEVGVAELSQKDIAEKSKLSIKSIKRYFNTKTDLIFQVSKMILKRNYEEIMDLYYAQHPEKENGKKRLEMLVKAHNLYVLREYKTTIFMMNADIFCRYHDDTQGKFWKEFRHTNSLQQGIKKMIQIGQEDGSIRRELPGGEFEYFVTTLCVGFVERMVNDIDCGIKTVDEAIELSNTLIDTTLRYF
ncbi:MAG: TetR/AcrR family transcriptional regulator [Clostridia bacterium]|nr:TetR/AcrR family transcriptional regulator [Clostridia bacterium]NCC43793.1 TetR/AcrR family transcriptional regulator [Clostridia bacterium]